MSKDEIIDEELQKIGVRFTDETQKPAPKEKIVNAKWEPVPKHIPQWRRTAKGCAKWVVVCGGISALLLFFKANELMAIQAAFPCICVCMALGGYGVGKHTTEGRKGA